MEDEEDVIIAQAKKDYMNITADYGLDKNLSKHLPLLNKRIAELNKWINTREIHEISSPHFFHVVEICYRFYFLRDKAKME